MAADYTITDQRPVTDATAAGVFVPAVEIRFVTKPSQQPGVVRVPTSMYTTDHVDDVVGAAARTIEAVQHL